MQSNLNIESFQKCQNIYQIPSNNIEIGNDILCPTGKAQIPNLDALYGDSGGPLFKLCLQDLMFCMETQVLIMEHVLATIQVFL